MNCCTYDLLDVLDLLDALQLPGWSGPTHARNITKGGSIKRGFVATVDESQLPRPHPPPPLTSFTQLRWRQASMPVEALRDANELHGFLYVFEFLLSL